LPEGEKIRRLIQSIKEVRFKKTAAGLKVLDGHPIQIDGVSFMELNDIRPFLLESMNHASKFAALEVAERQERQAGMLRKGPSQAIPTKIMDSQDPFSNYPMSASDDFNPYSEANNPYAFSTYNQ
jgi:hypothetical protein